MSHALRARGAGAVCASLALQCMPLGAAVQTDTTSQTGAVSLAPFFAHYTADWRNINVGTSDLELKLDGEPGRYVYTWTMTARGVFRLMYANDVVQKSWLAIENGHVRPLQYRAGDGTSTVVLDFDWDALHARGVAETKPVDLELDTATQDIMSIQVEVMLDLKNGRLPPSFRIIDHTAAKEFAYSEEGTERIRTALGWQDTVVVASQRRGNDRVLRMWFAPALGYVPVQAERTRGGTLEFAMRIKTLKR